MFLHCLQCRLIISCILGASISYRPMYLLQQYAAYVPAVHQVPRFLRYTSLNVEPKNFSFQYVNSHWLLKSCQWRQLGDLESTGSEEMKKRKFSDHKMHRFLTFHRGLCAALNPLRPGTPKICWINAIVGCAVFMFLLMIWCFFTKENIIFIKILRQKMSNCKSVIKRIFL